MLNDELVLNANRSITCYLSVADDDGHHVTSRVIQARQISLILSSLYIVQYHAIINSYRARFITAATNTPDRISTVRSVLMALSIVFNETTRFQVTFPLVYLQRGGLIIRAISNVGRERSLILAS